MKKTVEAVSLGHPDKISDYITSYILDRMIEQDNQVKYAVEVMIKENTVILGGEINGNVNLDKLKDYVIMALAEIGYHELYALWWKQYTIQPSKLQIINLISNQSDDINKGVEQGGWGDQGIFVGYACKGQEHISREYFLAKKLNKALYTHAKNIAGLGIDIKTQITLNELGGVETVIVAIPMLNTIDLTDFIIKTLGETPENIIINGTGIYKYHASIADCGVTGRKLACDFYGNNAPIGGGCMWGKDARKADVTLNIYARKLALEYLNDNDECFVYLSSCIGQAELPSAVVKTIKHGISQYTNIVIKHKPSEIISLLGLNKPIFTKLCRDGLISF